MREQRVILKHHVDGALMRQHMRDVAPVQEDATFIRRLEAGEHAEQRGLATAARTEQREKLPGRDIERQPVDSAERAEILDDALDPQQRRACRKRRRLGDRQSRGGVGFHRLRRRFDLCVVLCHLLRWPNGGRKLAADRAGLNRTFRTNYNINGRALPLPPAGE